MNDRPKDALRTLVERFGAELAQDPRRTAALLRDLCGEYRLEISLIATAAEEGVATELVDRPDAVPVDTKIAQLARRLEQGRGLTPENARFAVEAWAQALSKDNPAQEQSPAAPEEEVTDPIPPAEVTDPQETDVSPASPWWRRRSVIVITAALLLASVGVLVSIALTDDQIVVEGLSAEATAEGGVLLRWDPPTGGSDGLTYTIARDGGPLAKADPADGSYRDETVTPARNYTYEVVAIDDAGTRRSPPATVAIHTPLAPAPTLGATAVSGGEIRLSWSPPGTGNDDLGYVISRNGKPLDSVDASPRMYSDFSVSPSRTYTYELIAVDASRTYRSQPATVTLDTPPAPPYSDALLQGRWQIKGAYTSTNYSNESNGAGVNDTWTLHPLCRTPDCAVRLKAERAANSLLTRSGGERSGSGSYRYSDANCGPARETDTVVLSINDARFVAGVWTATRIAGTIHEYSTYDRCTPGYGFISYTGAPKG